MTIVGDPGGVVGAGAQRARPWWVVPGVVAVIIGAAIGALAPEPVAEPGPTAESIVAAYLAATSAGDEQAALDIWLAFPANAQTLNNEWRVQFTHRLTTERMGRSYTVTKVAYHPNGLQHERDATFAALLVEANGDAVSHRLVFDLYVDRFFVTIFPASPRSGGKWVLYDVGFGECNDAMQGWSCGPPGTRMGGGTP